MQLPALNVNTNKKGLIIFPERRGIPAKIKADSFVEWEEVYNGQFYGTLRSEMERIWKEDKAIVFDIDVNGATKLKSSLVNSV